MSRYLSSLLSRRRLVLTAALLMAVAGLASWFTMPRQEDPTLPPIWGHVVVPFPGADAETVERLILEPLEEELAEVEDLHLVEATAWAELAYLHLELGEDTADPDSAWDDVRRAVATARFDFPAEAGEPAIRDDLRDQESIVLMLTGSTDPLVLADAAERVKRRLLALGPVRRVTEVGDPGEQITVELSDAEARRLGLSPALLAATLRARNQVIPGGSLELAGKQVTLRPGTDMGSLEEIAATPILLPSAPGAAPGGINAVPLSSVAVVRRGPREPALTRARVDGEMAVAVGVVPRYGIDVVHFGKAVREEVERLRPELAPLELRELIFQPARVEARLSDLGRSLLTGILIVAAVLMLTMGLRLGLVVASVVPLVTLAALALYALGGGVLHQMSIAALVIALGMLVDNAIVVAETIQTRIDAGEVPRSAAVEAVKELAIPLAGATGTTLAAFVPMLAAGGITAVFTRAIPIVIMLTLTVSYLFAVLVTPALAHSVLRPRPGQGGGPGSGKRSAGRRIGQLAVSRPLLVLACALLVVGASTIAAGWVPGQFFPASDRNQIVVDLELPEGAHLDATDEVSRRLERAAARHPAVTAVSAFLGRSVPHFYYNLNQIPQSPHLAQVVLTTQSKAEVDEVLTFVRDFAREQMPEVKAVARKLEQGPPVLAPIEVRLYSWDLEELERAAIQVSRAIAEIPGTQQVRHDLGVGTPTLELTIDDAAAGRLGLTRADVALALYGRTRGLPAGTYRAGEDPVPVVVRAAAGENLPADSLAGVDVGPMSPSTGASGSGPVPLGQVSSTALTFRPAAIRHRNGRRVVTVLAQLAPGVSFSRVLEALVPRLEGTALGQAGPDGRGLGSVEWELGGDAEGSGEANRAIASAAPLGALLLVGILLAEFNSFRRVGIVLITVPLAAAGVVPGLLIGGQPFGFMSLLGVVALIGVVVNNAIVLLDVVERQRTAGATIPEALTAAVERRTRPILLTTATTVAGMLPLAFSSSSLWPPMAWAMISGLLASTFLTLLVVPALYRLLFEPRSLFPGPRRDAIARHPTREAATLGMLLFLLLFPLASTLPVAAETAAAGESAAGKATDREGAAQTERLTLSLEEAMERAGGRAAVAAADAVAGARREEAQALQRTTWWPTAGTSASYLVRDRELELRTPFGITISQGDRRRVEAGAELSQPLFDPARLHALPAARHEAEAAGLDAERVRQLARGEAAAAWLQIQAIDARGEALHSLVGSLDARLEEIDARVREGRALEADSLKVSLAVDAARQEQLALAEARWVALEDLARVIGVPALTTTTPLGTAGESAGGVEVAAELPAVPGPVEAENGTPSARRQVLAARPDLLALATRLRALDELARSVRARRLPRLDAKLRWTYTDADFYTESSWTEGALTVSWRPFAAGTQGPLHRAALAEREALAHHYEEALSGARLEVAAARADLRTARAAVKVGERGVEQATETLRVETERFRVGRTTTNDLLDAEALLAQQRTTRALAQIEVVHAWVRLRLALGVI